MDRRDALRAATAIAWATTVAGCDAGPDRRPSPPTAEPAGPTQSAAVPEPSATPLPDEITQGPPGAKVALTFHGQGSPAVVVPLLDALAAGGARVTVLAVGTWLAGQRTLARRILSDGHELGNHTQHHADIKRMTAAEAHAEIDQCAQLLRVVTGSVGRWFRPSQTQHATPTIKSEARRVGYPTCLSYDVDSLDYTDPGADAVVATTLRQVKGGSIVSLHFGHAGTVAAIGPILAGLKQRGLIAVTMSELMA